MKLVVGTANFMNEYNGACVDENEIKKIYEVMNDNGVKWLDIAETYNNLKHISTYFKCIVKTKKYLRPMNYWLSHSIEKYSHVQDGASIYYPTEILVDMTVIEFPYSIWDNRFKVDDITQTKIARSVFLRGRYFSELETLSKKTNIPIPALCLNYVYWNDSIDYVIIGVDSAEMLKQNIYSLNYKNKVLELMRNGEFDKLDSSDNLDKIIPMRW